MDNFRDYYGILGIPPTASAAEVKQNFRRLARKYHPDLNPGDKVAEDKFKQIGEAYEILADEIRRAEYDQFATYWQAKEKQRPRQTVKKWVRSPAKPKNSTEVRFEQYADFNSFLDDLLNRKTVRNIEPPPPPGSRVDPDRADAFEPRSSKAAYTVSQQTRPRSTPSTSSTPPRSTRPKPAATQPQPKSQPKSQPRSQPTPSDIEARLTVPLDRAFSGGRERIRLEDGRSLDVNMPAGIVNGQRIRLKAQGRNGGDLFLKITVAAHPFFSLDGADVCCQLPITPSEAVLGGAIPVPTLGGAVKMRLPAGVKSGQRLRLPGKGFPVEGGDRDERGDQLVEVQIVVPDQPSEEERKLYEQLREIETFQPRRDLP
jgi:curved DNA-binding protein